MAPNSVRHITPHSIKKGKSKGKVPKITVSKAKRATRIVEESINRSYLSQSRIATCGYRRKIADLLALNDSLAKAHQESKILNAMYEKQIIEFQVYMNCRGIVRVKLNEISSTMNTMATSLASCASKIMECITYMDSSSEPIPEDTTVSLTCVVPRGSPVMEVNRLPGEEVAHVDMSAIDEVFDVHPSEAELQKQVEDELQIQDEASSNPQEPILDEAVKEQNTPEKTKRSSRKISSEKADKCKSATPKDQVSSSAANDTPKTPTLVYVRPQAKSQIPKPSVRLKEKNTPEYSAVPKALDTKIANVAKLKNNSDKYNLQKKTQLSPRKQESNNKVSNSTRITKPPSNIPTNATNNVNLKRKTFTVTPNSFTQDNGNSEEYNTRVDLVQPEAAVASTNKTSLNRTNENSILHTPVLSKKSARKTFVVPKTFSECGSALDIELCDSIDSATSISDKTKPTKADNISDLPKDSSQCAVSSDIAIQPSEVPKTGIKRSVSKRRKTSIAEIALNVMNTEIKHDKTPNVADTCTNQKNLNGSCKRKVSTRTILINGTDGTSNDTRVSRRISAASILLSEQPEMRNVTRRSSKRTISRGPESIDNDGAAFVDLSSDHCIKYDSRRETFVVTAPSETNTTVKCKDKSLSESHLTHKSPSAVISQPVVQLYDILSGTAYSSKQTSACNRKTMVIANRNTNILPDVKKQSDNLAKCSIDNSIPNASLNKLPRQEVQDTDPLHITAVTQNVPYNATKEQEAACIMMTSEEPSQNGVQNTVDPDATNLSTKLDFNIENTVQEESTNKHKTKDISHDSPNVTLHNTIDMELTEVITHTIAPIFNNIVVENTTVADEHLVNSENNPELQHVGNSAVSESTLPKERMSIAHTHNDDRCSDKLEIRNQLETPVSLENPKRRTNSEFSNSSSQLKRPHRKRYAVCFSSSDSDDDNDSDYVVKETSSKSGVNKSTKASRNKGVHHKVKRSSSALKKNMKADSESANIVTNKPSVKSRKSTQKKEPSNIYDLSDSSDEEFIRNIKKGKTGKRATKVLASSDEEVVGNIKKGKTVKRATKDKPGTSMGNMMKKIAKEKLNGHSRKHTEASSVNNKNDSNKEDKEKEHINTINDKLQMGPSVSDKQDTMCHVKNSADRGLSNQDDENGGKNKTEDKIISVALTKQTDTQEPALCHIQDEEIVTTVLTGTKSKEKDLKIQSTDHHKVHFAFDTEKENASDPKEAPPKKSAKKSKGKKDLTANQNKGHSTKKKKKQQIGVLPIGLDAVKKLAAESERSKFVSIGNLKNYQHKEQKVNVTEDVAEQKLGDLSNRSFKEHNANDNHVKIPDSCQSPVHRTTSTRKTSGSFTALTDISNTETSKTNKDLKEVTPLSKGINSDQLQPNARRKRPVSYKMPSLQSKLRRS